MSALATTATARAVAARLPRWRARGSRWCSTQWLSAPLRTHASHQVAVHERAAERAWHPERSFVSPRTRTCRPDRALGRAVWRTTWLRGVQHSSRVCAHSHAGTREAIPGGCQHTRTRLPSKLNIDITTRLSTRTAIKLQKQLVNLSTRWSSAPSRIIPYKERTGAQEASVHRGHD